MAFNFGDKPFKHSLPEGFAPINTAPKANIVQNTNGQAASSASVKPSNNAPQAIIIEVCSALYLLVQENIPRCPLRILFKVL